MTKIEEKNEIVNVESNEVVPVVKNKVSLFSNIQEDVYCSIVTDTMDEKKKLFNALEQCDALLNDCVGTEIAIKDVYCEEKQVIDDVTGELKTKFRTILFATNGQTYATGSYGIYNVIKKLTMIYGLPTWTDGLKVKVAKRPIKNGKSTLTLNIV